MNEDMADLTKYERKIARRKQRADSERGGERSLDELATEAVELAEELVHEVADAPDQAASERVLDIEIGTLDAARHVRKLVTKALATAEWTDEIEVWVWEFDTHVRPPLTERGAESGFEVRLQQRGAFIPAD